MRRASLLSLLVFACSSPTKAPSKPAREPVAVPGACVDPKADAAERLTGDGSAAFEPDLVETLVEATGPDVDGDGRLDPVMIVGMAITTHAFVYVRRGGCGHYVGDVVQAPQADPAGAARQGLVDLVVVENFNCEGAACGCELGEMWYRFDGTQYVLDEAAVRPSAATECPE